MKLFATLSMILLSFAGISSFATSETSAQLVRFVQDTDSPELESYLVDMGLSYLVGTSFLQDTPLDPMALKCELELAGDFAGRLEKILTHSEGLQAGSSEKVVKILLNEAVYQKEARDL